MTHPVKFKYNMQTGCTAAERRPLHDKLCKTIFLIFVLILLTAATNVYAADFKWQIGNTISPSFWMDRDIDAEPGYESIPNFV